MVRIISLSFERRRKVNVIQSRWTAYSLPTTTGASDEYSVPVKGTAYSSMATRDVRHGYGGYRYRWDACAVVNCGT